MSSGRTSTQLAADAQAPLRRAIDAVEAGGGKTLVRLLDKGILRDLRDKQNERTAQQLSDAAQASPAPN